jgi:YHS domain-containing protein
MDTESLKSLGTLLFWGALFYLMMRFGCGAHMMGGHGGHGSHGGSGGEKDPVCGMAVDPEKAAGASVHAGKTYYFCSTSCRDKFEKEPAQYAAGSARDDHQHGGHHHG